MVEVGFVEVSVAGAVFPVFDLVPSRDYTDWDLILYLLLTDLPIIFLIHKVVLRFDDLRLIGVQLHAIGNLIGIENAVGDETVSVPEP